jgi:hypothetical protein
MSLIFYPVPSDWDYLLQTGTAQEFLPAQIWQSISETTSFKETNTKEKIQEIAAHQNMSSSVTRKYNICLSNRTNHRIPYCWKPRHEGVPLARKAPARVVEHGMVLVVKLNMFWKARNTQNALSEIYYEELQSSSDE